MADKYDKAIEYLKEHPEEIREAWGLVFDHPAGCLFGFATPTPGDGCGCLTQIRSEMREAKTKELTDAIRADERIPKVSTKIALADLPVFAEWQRRLDRELGRTP